MDHQSSYQSTKHRTNTVDIYNGDFNGAHGEDLVEITTLYRYFIDAGLDPPSKSFLIPFATPGTPRPPFSSYTFCYWVNDSAQYSRGDDSIERLASSHFQQKQGGIQYYASTLLREAAKQSRVDLRAKLITFRADTPEFIFQKMELFPLDTTCIDLLSCFEALCRLVGTSTNLCHFWIA